MLRLTLVIYSMAATALAGGAVTAALASGFVDARSIIIAAAVGAVVALPVSYLVARSLSSD